MPKIYGSCESAEEIANKLVPTYHPELGTARIAYICVDKASMKSGRPVLGKSRKVSGSLEFLLEKDFIVEIALDQWNDLSPKQRTALIDHLLEYCTGEEDEEDAGAPMKWSVREPDVKEFMTVLQRHGAWNEELSGFVSVCSRLDVNSMVNEVVDTTATETVRNT